MADDILAKGYDPRYDFKVPEFDFNQLEEEEEADSSELDKYFEFDHENGVPIDLGADFDPPTAKRCKPDEASDQQPRRALRNTPARQGAAAKLAADVSASSAPAEGKVDENVESEGEETMETPVQSPRQLRARSLGSGRKPAPENSTLPSNLCTSLSSWNKKKKVTPTQTSSKQPARNSQSRITKAKVVKTTEEQELEKIRALREEVVRKRRIAEKSHKRALSSSSTHMPQRSVQAPTKVNEFAFATDKRVPDKTNSAIATEHKNFTKLLRHYQPLKAQRKGPTIPIETNLYSRKRRHGEDTQKSAEIAPLWSKTPERFHTQPKNAKYQPVKRSRRSVTMNMKITMPITPKLEANKRARRVHVISQKEIEEKEAQEMKSYQFRARPLNQRMFDETNLGVPRKNPKEATVAVSPDFATVRRIQHYHANKEEQQLHNSFHARPIPKGMLDGPLGIKEVASLPVTRPKTPNFALKNRVHSSSASDASIDSEHSEDHIIRANPIPDLNKKFEVKIQKSVVRVEPFSFDKRDQSINIRKQHLIKEEELRLERLRQFRARNPHVLLKEPFIPKPSTQPLTDMTDLHLNTEHRSMEREKWEACKAETDRQTSEAKVEEERRRQEEERKEVELLRRQAVHRAQPVRHYNPVKIQRSTVPPTIAQSPRFSKRLRDRPTQL